MKRNLTLAIALICAPFLMLIIIIVVLFGGGVGGIDAEQSTSPTGGRALKQLAVPAWAYDPLIAAATFCPEITAPLLAAQLETESDWDPNAHNDESGADGLAQFIPTTWQAWGQDGDRDGKADPRNPADAIRSQAAYMCHLVGFVKQHPELVGDLIDLALAAYNAGPSRVVEYRGIPPFLETTSYIHKIRQLATTKYAEITETGGTSAAVDAARRWIGTIYAWGGGSLNGPSAGMAPDAGVIGFDCSGLVRHAVYQGSNGTLTLPRTSQTQYNATNSNPVAVDQLQPGDLLFWGGASSVHHVAIYSGNGHMVEAPQSGQAIRETPIRTGGDYLGATRIARPSG